MTRRVEVPDPEVDLADEGDLSTHAVPLDASGAIGGWIRRHVVEISIFLAVILLMSIGTFLIMRDPGPGDVLDVDVVGPAPGQDLDPYIAVRRRALDDAAAVGGERVGVVSFSKRLTAPELAEFTIPKGVAIEGVIAGVNRDDGEIITEGEIGKWISNQLNVYEAQFRGADEQLAASPSPTHAADWFTSEKERAQVSLDRLRAGSVVEGLIVRGPVRDLALIQQEPSVVLVDLAAEGKSPAEVIPVLVGVSE
ncbi:MAG: hypothetical protein DCC49_02450 [Acidobacteria bacterium]|nr:MAG: hypothetical protein DCC49_02450 [Acidobacteriota bacterium]